VPDFLDIAPDDSVWELPGDDAVAVKMQEPEQEPFATPAEPAEPAATEAEPAAADRPRNPDGTFAKAASDPAPDSAPEHEAEAEAEVAAAPDDFRTEFAKLEERLAEKDAFIGRLSNELGELRAQTQPKPPEQPAYDPQAVSDYLDENPHQIIPAIQQAYQTGNRAMVYQGIAKLREYSPAQAEELSIAVATADAQAAAQRVVAPVAEMTSQQHLVQTFHAAAAAQPGLAEFVGSDDAVKLAQEFPTFGQMIALGTPDQKIEAMSALHQVHRGRLGDTLKVQTEEIARASHEQAQQAREEAFVASANTASSGTKPSKAEQYAADWNSDIEALNAGWNV
jgi:hypothetical protein